MPPDKIEDIQPKPKVSIKVNLPNPMTPTPAQMSVPRPSPKPVQASPVPQPSSPQQQSTPAPAPALKLKMTAPAAAPSPTQAPSQQDASKNPRNKKGCVLGCIAGFFKFISSLFSFGLLILVIYVTYNQFIRKPRHDVITPVRTWLIDKFQIGYEWFQQYLPGGADQSEDEEEEDEAPAPRSRPAPDPEPVSAPVDEPVVEIPMTTAVDIESTPEFQKLLTQCEARRPKTNQKITLKLRNRPEAMDGVVTDISDSRVTLKVKEGYVDCPFSILEEKDRLRFFPREWARKIYEQKMDVHKP